MAKMTVIPPQTAAESTGVVVDSGNLGAQDIIISADNLATTEEVDVEVYVGNDTYKAYRSGGAVVVLTATEYVKTLPAGPTYRLKKDATAGACGVIIQWSPISRRN